MSASSVIWLFLVAAFGVCVQYNANQEVRAILKSNARHDNAAANKGSDQDRNASMAGGFPSSGSERSYVGAVVVHQDGILAEGTGVSEASDDFGNHAAADLLRRIGTERRTFPGSVLYSTNQPCDSCLSLISSAGIREVFYCSPLMRLQDVRHPKDSSQARAHPVVVATQITREELDSVIVSYRARTKQVYR
jgi:tRNA(Arg) A34 adenosine deaminase TadA